MGKSLLDVDLSAASPSSLHVCVYPYTPTNQPASQVCLEQNDFLHIPNLHMENLLEANNSGSAVVIRCRLFWPLKTNARAQFCGGVNAKWELFFVPSVARSFSVEGFPFP